MKSSCCIALVVVGMGVAVTKGCDPDLLEGANWMDEVLVGLGIDDMVVYEEDGLSCGSDDK